YRDEDGTSHSLDLGVGKLQYDPTTNKLTYTAEGSEERRVGHNETGLEYEAEDGILTYTNSLGVKQRVNLSDIVSEQETLTELGYDPAAHVLTYRDEDGTSHSLDLSVGKLLYDPTTNKLTYTAEDGTPTEIPLNETGLEY